MSKETTTYKTLIFVLDFSHYSHIYNKKKALQIFCATNECDRNCKEWCFLLKWMVTKRNYDTNKNVTKMGVIIKGVYYIWLASYG